MDESSSSSSSSDITKKRKRLENQEQQRNFEDELASDLEKDDVEVIQARFNSYRKRIRQVENKLLCEKMGVDPSINPTLLRTNARRTKTQWTRSLDAVQEHFSSHVQVDGTSHKLPAVVYALKLESKHSWLLYKKRECERRKRIRKKLEDERKKERDKKEPANILLSMVDMCEICKRLYVTVNLFWGVTICDICYFSPSVINDIMKSKYMIAEKKIEITPENVVEEITRRCYDASYLEGNRDNIPLPGGGGSFMCYHRENEEETEQQDENVSNDFRPFSTYVSPSNLNSPSLPHGSVLEQMENVEDLVPEDLFDEVSLSTTPFSWTDQNSALFYTLPEIQ